MNVCPSVVQSKWHSWKYVRKTWLVNHPFHGKGIHSKRQSPKLVCQALLLEPPYPPHLKITTSRCLLLHRLPLSFYPLHSALA